MFRCVNNWVAYILKPFIRVQKLIHKIILCLSSIVQTVTMLLIIFHVFAVIGMMLFDQGNMAIKEGSPYTESIGNFDSY